MGFLAGVELRPSAAQPALDLGHPHALGVSRVDGGGAGAYVQAIA